MKEKWHIKLSIAGEHPTLILLGFLDFKIPEQTASVQVACLQRSVQDADENNIATHCRRRKHERFSLLAHDGLATIRIDHVIQTRVGCSEEHFPISNGRRRNHPAQVVKDSPL